MVFIRLLAFRVSSVLIFVLDFFVVTGFSNLQKCAKNGIKTIFGHFRNTHARYSRNFGCVLFTLLLRACVLSFRSCSLCRAASRSAREKPLQDPEKAVEARITRPVIFAFFLVDSNDRARAKTANFICLIFRITIIGI